VAGIVTNNFRLHNANSFISQNNGNDYYYAFIGHPIEWEPVPSPTENLQSTSDIWQNMIAMKKIASSDMVNGIKNRIWVDGSYYNTYRHDYGDGVVGKNIGGDDITINSLIDANFYVVDEDSWVYVCLINNNDGPSTVNPNSPSLDYDSYNVAWANDGYAWKRIATFTASDLSSFSTLDYVPIRTYQNDVGGQAVVDQYSAQNACDDGAINSIIIDSGGSGYLQNKNPDRTQPPDQAGNEIHVTLNGDGVGFIGYAKTDGSGKILQIHVADPGQGYTYVSAVNFSGGGSGAICKPIIQPKGGLGSDPIRDLCGHNVIVHLVFSEDENGNFPIMNQYCQIGIVVNPLQRNTALPLTTTYGRPTLKLEVSTISSFVVDAVLHDTTPTVISTVDGDINVYAAGIMVDKFVSGGNFVRLIRTATENSDSYHGAGVFHTGTGNLSDETNNTANIIAITLPDVEHNSGEIIYFENRHAIGRNESQIEELKIVFEF
jgi:hypothetical protein